MRRWLWTLLLAPGLVWAQQEALDAGTEPVPAPSVENLPAPEASPEPASPPAAPVAAQPPPPDPPGLETVVKSAPVVDIRRVAGSAHVFTKEDMERHEYDDVNNLLRGTAGVYLRTEDGYGLRPNIGLRGASSDRSSKVTLMEDGVLFAPAPYSAPAAYYFPLITRMVGAELYKGPASIRYGPNTIGGAFNLRTRDVPQHLAAELDLGLGAYRGAKVHGFVGYGTEHWGALLEGVHLGNGGFKQLDNGGPTGFDKNEVMGKVRWSGALGSGAQSVELKLMYADEVSDETYLGLSDHDFFDQPLRRYSASQLDQMKWIRYGAQLRHRLKVGSVQLDATAYWHRQDRTWNRLNGFRRGPDLRELLARPGTGQDAVWMAILRGEEDSSDADQALVLAGNERSFLSQGVQWVATHQVQLGPVEQRLELGARFHHDHIHRHHTAAGYDMVRGQLVRDITPTEDTTRNMAFTRAWSFYAQDELAYGSWLFVPGLRLELIDNGLTDRLTQVSTRGHDVVLLPGMGVVRQLGKHFSVLLGAHQGFSPVSPGQPAEVKPELSWNYEAGVRFRSRPVKAELIAFLNDYFNITGECTFSSGCPESQLNRQFNGGAARVYGLEASTSARLPPVWGSELSLEAAYTLSLSEFLTSFTSAAPQFGSVRAGDMVPYIPTHLVSAGLRAKKEGWSLSLSANYVGEVREQAGSGPIPVSNLGQAHLLVDAAIHRAIGNSSEAYLTVNNLLNSQYVAAHRPFGARPGAPVNGFIGFKHRF